MSRVDEPLKPNSFSIGLVHKEELTEKVKKLETGILEVGMNDHKTIAFSGLNED